MSFTKVSQEKQSPTLRPTLVLAPSPDIDKVISFDSSIEVFHYNYRVPINVVKTIKTFKLVDGARCFYIKKAPSTFTIKDFDPFDCFKSQIVSTDMGLNFFVMPDCGIDLSDFIAYTFAESRGYSKRFEVLSKTPKGVEQIKRIQKHRLDVQDKIVHGLLQMAVKFKESRVVHHDLRPENIMLESDGTTSIIDWLHYPHVASKRSSVESYSQTLSGLNSRYQVCTDDNLITIAHLIILLEISFKLDLNEAVEGCLIRSFRNPYDSTGVEVCDLNKAHMENMHEVYQVLKTFPSRYIPDGFFDGLETLPIPPGKGKDLGGSIISMIPKSDDFWVKCDEIPAGFDNVIRVITKRSLDDSFIFKPTRLKRQKKGDSKNNLGDDLI